jgi:hypothetical protein
MPPADQGLAGCQQVGTVTGLAEHFSVPRAHRDRMGAQATRSRPHHRPLRLTARSSHQTIRVGNVAAPRCRVLQPQHGYRHGLL